jgi:hypothetical protein
MCRRGRLGLADAGEPVIVSPGDDQALVLSVRLALDGYASNTFAESQSVPRKERARFIREHDSIMVVCLDDALTLTPWEHAEGGFASNDDASITLRSPVAETDLASAIRQAFEGAR